MAGRITYYGNVASNGLVLYLDAANRMSYPGSGNTWYDLSKYKNNCTLNATYTPIYDPTNRYFKFTAANFTRAVVPNHSSLNFGTGDFTILHFSEHPVAGNNTGGSVLFKGARFDANRAGWLVTSHAGANLYSVVSDGSSRKEMLLQPAFSTFSLGLYGLMRKGGVLYDIRDGIANVGSPLYGTYNGNVDSTDDLTIGLNPVYGNCWNGNISNILIYNRTLTQQELTQSSNALKSRFGL